MSNEKGEKLSDVRRRYLELKKAQLIGFKKDHFKNSNNRMKETWKVHMKHINEQLNGKKPPFKETIKKVLGSVTKKIIPLGALLASSPAYKRGGLIKGKNK